MRWGWICGFCGFAGNQKFELLGESLGTTYLRCSSSTGFEKLGMMLKGFLRLLEVKLMN